MARKSRAKQFPKRRGPQREPYPRILIVCEGSKTEPNYFREMIDHFKLSTANVVVDGSSDSAPISVVRHAKKEYKKDKSFDQVYCVIDKDQHASYKQALAQINDFNPKNVLQAICSVPCFEFWLLLHFVKITKLFAPSGKRSPCGQVERDLKSFLPNYDKGKQGVFLQVVEHLDVAIKHAEQVNKLAAQSDTDNPSTQICVLVKDLRDLKNSNKST